MQNNSTPMKKIIMIYIFSKHQKKEPASNLQVPFYKF